MKKKGISSKIQTRIGKSVSIIFVLVALIVILVTNSSITEANDTELTLESQSASHQLSDFFNQYCSIAEGMTTNLQIQQYLDTTMIYADIRANENFESIMNTLKGIQSLHSDTILASWIADSDVSGLVMSDGYIAEEAYMGIYQTS